MYAGINNQVVSAILSAEVTVAALLYHHIIITLFFSENEMQKDDCIWNVTHNTITTFARTTTIRLFVFSPKSLSPSYDCLILII